MMDDTAFNWVSSIQDRGMTRLGPLLCGDHPKLDDTWAFTRMGKKYANVAVCCRLCHASCQVHFTTGIYSANEEEKLAKFLLLDKAENDEEETEDEAEEAK